MERTQARRAQKSLWPTRLAALAVPAALVGLLSSGVAIAAWPDRGDVLAQPVVAAGSASASSSPAAARDDSTERTTRLLANGRPALSATDSAAAAAKAKADAAKKKADAAEKKAEAEKKAARAKKKAAAEAKAEKKAEAKKAARKRAAAEKKAAEKAAAKKRAEVFKPTAAQREVTGHRYSRVSLNVRTQPKSSSDLVVVVKRGTRLSVTDTTKGAWTLVIHRGKPRWVHTEYLVKDKPKKVKAKTSSSSSSSSGGGISGKACSSGSGMESGLTKDAIRVHRAVCAEFPSVKSYGGMRSGGDSFHTSGRAVDIMVSGSRGQAIADWVRSHRKELGVSEIIWSQRIWTVQRGSEGWRSMSDRGNATANHFDHVHVSVYGNRGTS